MINGLSLLEEVDVPPVVAVVINVLLEFQTEMKKFLLCRQSRTVDGLSVLRIEQDHLPGLAEVLADEAESMSEVLVDGPMSHNQELLMTVFLREILTWQHLSQDEVLHQLSWCLLHILRQLVLELHLLCHVLLL